MFQQFAIHIIYPDAYRLFQITAMQLNSKGVCRRVRTGSNAKWSGLRARNILNHQEKIRQHHNAQLTNPKEPINLQTVENGFLKQIYTIIKENIDDSSLNIGKLAREMAVSHRTLNRKLNAW